MRPDQRFHTTDADLIRLSDGELTRRQAAKAQAHVAACWQCRSRMRELENTIGEFIQVRGEALDAAISGGPSPRAIFRARLSELAGLEPPPTSARLWSSSVPVAAAAFLTIVVLLVTFGGTVSADGPKPRINLTPGETRPVSLAEVCAAPEPANATDREIPDEVKRQVFASYGMDPAQAGAYEVDYLITPELGGAYTARNLWPQPYSARWNARVKDKLEHRLHHLVCQGKVDLATAQHDISTDWIGAYRKYVSSALPR